MENSELSIIGKLVFSNWTLTKKNIDSEDVNIKLPDDIVFLIDKYFLMFKEYDAEKYVSKIIDLTWTKPYISNSIYIQPYVDDIINNKNKRLCLKILLEKDEFFKNAWITHKGDSTRDIQTFTHPSHTWLSSLSLAWIYIRVH